MNQAPETPDPLASVLAGLRVERGNPTPEELAAAIAIIAAAAGQHTAVGSERKLASTWSRNASMLRGNIAPGPGQWRFTTRMRSR